MTATIRSFTTRSLCGLFAAAVLVAVAPTAAFADHRDDGRRRGERHYDHGRYRGRDFDHRWGAPAYFRRPSYRVYRHGPSCSARPVTRYGYRPVRPYGFVTRYGVTFR